jgi:hypothetical protein
MVFLVILIHIKVYYHRLIKSIQENRKFKIYDMLKDIGPMSYSSYEVSPIYFKSNFDKPEIRRIEKKIHTVIVLYYIVIVSVAIFVLMLKYVWNY